MADPPPVPHRVLIVDDEPSTLTLLERFLSDVGYQVEQAGSASDALAVLRERGTDVLITDWLMPRIDGIELCRTVREHEEFGFVYIVMLTIQSETRKLVEALDNGADDYLRKPFDRDELLARVRVGCRHIDLQRELSARTVDIHRCNAQLATLAEKLTTMATTDALTELLNRGEALARLEGAWATANLRHQPLTCIMADIDHFKKINDTHGHAVGDCVLTHVARVLRGHCRPRDIVARFGGEEFLIVCPQTELGAALQLAGTLRSRIAIPVELDAGVVTPTASLGVAEKKPGMLAPADLLRAADAALYDAKRGGRNRVQVG